MDSNLNKYSQVVLVIIDGWGIRDDKKDNAIETANKPFFDYLWKNYPHSKLCANGECVGLPAGEMGNSEVGHTTIGAGTPMDTDVVRIFKSINQNTLKDNHALNQLVDHVKKYDSTLHLFGLISPGFVHSHQEHLFSLIRIAKEKGVKKVVIHAFTDGRDTSPRSAATYINQLELVIKNEGLGFISTVVGRYYAMDRDHNWDREKIAEDALFNSQGIEMGNAIPSNSIEKQYKEGLTDEFLKPLLFADENGNLHPIKQNDGLFFINFRADRARMLSQKISEKITDMNLCFVTMTQYDKNINSLVAFPQERPETTLAKEIANANLSQSHIAETEKYAHVTYFLNGGVETPYQREENILIDSRKDIPTHDQAPEMRAEEITNKAIEQLNNGVNFIVLNYANPDMVGHTGNAEATVIAVETVDQQLKRLVEASLEKGVPVFITSDHGNAELNAYEDSGEKHTAHTTSPVPAILTINSVALRDGSLSDVAPTILELFKIKKPEEMTGSSIIEK